MPNPSLDLFYEVIGEFPALREGADVCRGDMNEEGVPVGVGGGADPLDLP